MKGSLGNNSIPWDPIIVPVSKTKFQQLFLDDKDFCDKIRGFMDWAFVWLNITNPLETNTDWWPDIQEFNGVRMALVPEGCFVDDQGTEHCFDTPFWMDVYEVTNEQYGSEGYFKDDNRPRDSVKWSEAQAFCQARAARLPDEWEWEYAARGPDALVYPWGYDFVSENVVWKDNNCSGTCDVGSRLDKDSWVGAYDMSGNVWEWMVNDYSPGSPYKVKRGGSWGVYGEDLRASNRSYDRPSYTDFNIGFRCARDIPAGGSP